MNPIDIGGVEFRWNHVESISSIDEQQWDTCGTPSSGRWRRQEAPVSTAVWCPATSSSAIAPGRWWPASQPL
jgi:hypothetical protein